MTKRKIPKRFYKYRAFSNRTLDALLADQLFFADPGTFNDSLDCKPSIATDFDSGALADICARLVVQRVSAEMSAAFKTINLRGPKMLDHIAVQSQRRAEQIIAELRYSATNPEYEGEDPVRFFFGHYIEEELLRRYDKGIVSLAERSNCPLMWSHYGDQHEGVCMGYSAQHDHLEDLHKVSYGGSRLIKASTVAAMLDGDDAARLKVDKAVFAMKAIEWRYESEWRLVGPRGLRESPLELEEVIFGLRCSLEVKFAVVRALENRRRPVKFYEIRERRGEFPLNKCILDTDELCVSLPRARADEFDALADDE